MQRQEIVDIVNKTLIENFELKAEDLTPDALIGENLKLDSLDAVDMLVHLEDRLGTKYDIEKFKEVRKLNDIYNLVEEAISK
ncbi:acyl carrier protein [Bacteriovorax sp. PP10]|uniref:Acyl carrier protein n=1 Tax=Bacteriovorax antarcticus TaxID=3088717 RepID=A0ABU5VVW2_9BACT|nr:acyl carrier protein [Bacteriovorax sp. PP10]MEA9357184.1 acyl carrier protein [Bacteriovorax sp. PP10]